ncbi:hypothetical protein JDV02_000238 [Purpureocillium takamizusanense]|uniref:Uncharacterized protein n=1 Tax=Purpureocillium takamizusanense TaxID=2060973 RepID=A0A9Q8Q661_9HYPO|nr:uncharacterized protein JDV02_000238 [Purpureocillium takamizusanense]UNI13497.1 hypothetical protein JDV02_000238 [Purpureocillium takamizusanense]
MQLSRLGVAALGGVLTTRIASAATLTSKAVPDSVISGRSEPRGMNTLEPRLHTWKTRCAAAGDEAPAYCLQAPAACDGAGTYYHADGSGHLDECKSYWKCECVRQHVYPV